MSKDDNDEPIIEVVTTPIGEVPIKKEFSMTVNSGEISGTTVPPVAKTNTVKAVDLATVFLDNIKEKYRAEEYDLVITVNEEEEIDRGWFTHTDLGGGFDFGGGKWEAIIKGTPKKIKTTKKTTMKVGLEKKEE